MLWRPSVWLQVLAFLSFKLAWIHKSFRARHQITWKVKAGDGQEAAADTSIDDWKRDVLPTLVAGVEPRNIHNAVIVLKVARRRRIE